jgi:hypothetical protein
MRFQLAKVRLTSSRVFSLGNPANGRRPVLVFGVGVHAGPVNGTDLCCMFNEITAFDR